MAHLDAVTRLRRVQTGVDARKNPIYEDVVSELTPGARFAPRHVIPAAEAGREPVIVEPTLYWLKAWPDVVASDRLIVRGRTYEVQTIPADWRGSLTGGLVVALRDVVEGVA